MSILSRLFFRSRDKPTDSLPGGAFSFLFGGVLSVVGLARATVGGGIQMSIYDQRGLISF